MPKGFYHSLLLFCLLTVTNGTAQDPSNAFMLEWKVIENDQLDIVALDLYTGFNTKGYNNQPFRDKNELYLSSSWKENNTSQTNLFALNIKDKSIRQITDTEDSEYSPSVMDMNLYFVRLDAETKYQELWKYDGHTLHKVLPETNVAYYTPVSSDRFAVILIENNQLALYDINIRSNQKKKILDNVGRSLATHDNEVLYFVHKYSPEIWYIKSYDLFTGQIKIVSKTLPDSEDFTLQNSNHIWMAKDQRIYRTTIQGGIATSWENIFNLEDYPLNNIGRMCVIGDNQLIFINQ